MDYFLFWFNAGLAKMAWCLILLLIVLIPMFIYILVGKIKMALCPHRKFYENRSCDGICNKCGKNLGFVGKLDRRNQTN